MYKLRAELRAHSADVRGVAVSPSGIIAAASRDRTISLWDSSKDMHEPYLVLTGHDHFVNAIAFTDSGKLVSASSDKTLRVWDTKNGECLTVLRGHSKPVCAVSCLTLNQVEYVVSSSWDQTACVWELQSGSSLRVFSGHQAAVWSAIGLSDGRFVTVGADKTVRLWSPLSVASSSSTLPPIHTDVIRDVVPAPTGGFTTVANDSSLVCWTRSGESFAPSQTVPNLHDGNYTYSVDSKEISLDKWMFVTGGEDNAFRITELKNGQGSIEGETNAIQTVMHPGTVWSACFCPNGDIVSACSDGTARVFTKDPSCYAETDVLAAFEKAVSERQVNTKVIGGVDVGKLPKAEEALLIPGKKDGENRIVKTASGSAEVHMWSEAEQRWSKVGDVVDGPEGGTSLGAKDINGKQYDFVFEVELSEGGEKEKLGYNRGENPYTAAQRFIDDNEISQEFLDQVAQFIEQQVPAEALQAPAPGRSDPLTGGSRYVPRGTGAHTASTSQGDPLTGGSRYVPGGSNVPSRGLPPPRKLIPHRNGVVTYKSSDQLDKIQQKLSEFNSEIAKANADLALNMEEAQTFASSLIPKLKNRADSSVVFENEDCLIVEKMLSWPIKYIFAVLDIARLVISVPSGGAFFFGLRNGAILKEILSFLTSDEATSPVYIMGCRFLCNMFSNRIAGEVAKTRMLDILSATTKAATAENRRARETSASLLINYAVLLHDSKAPVSERQNVLAATVQRICGGENDEEVLYRLMLAMGTLICGDTDSARRGVELGVAKAAAEAAPKSARLQHVALEIATIVAT